MDTTPNPFRTQAASKSSPSLATVLVLSCLSAGCLLFGVVALIGAGIWAFSQTEIPQQLRSAEKIYGPESWSNRAEHFRAQVLDTDVRSRYAIHSFSEGLYEQLYDYEDFKSVEDALQRKLESAADPWVAFEYSKLIPALAELYLDRDPEAIRQTVTRWTNERPDSHFAWLIRGTVAKNYAWYWRGGGFANTVTEEGWENFYRYLEEATECLKRARALNPDDIESSVQLLAVMQHTDDHTPEFRRAFDDIVKRAPAHRMAYNIALASRYPKWGGSWPEVDRFLNLCRMKSREQGHPLLEFVIVDAYEQMQRYRPDYEDLYDRQSIREELEEIHRTAVEAWPESVALRVNYARILYWLQKYPEALEQFEIIGENYFEPSLWESVESYHHSRTFTLYMVGAKMGPDHREEYFARALELDPAYGDLYFNIGCVFRDEGDIARAEELYRAGIDVDPAATKNWLALAQMLGANRRFDEVVQLTEIGRPYFAPDDESLPQFDAMAKRAKQLARRSR